MKGKPKHTGFALRVRRLRLGLHQYEVAQSLGIHTARLCEFEHGRRKFRAELEARLHALLGLRPRKQDGDGQAEN